MANYKVLKMFRNKKTRELYEPKPGQVVELENDYAEKVEKELGPDYLERIEEEKKEEQKEKPKKKAKE